MAPVGGDLEGVTHGKRGGGILVGEVAERGGNPLLLHLQDQRPAAGDARGQRGADRPFAVVAGDGRGDPRTGDGLFTPPPAPPPPPNPRVPRLPRQPPQLPPPHT